MLADGVVFERLGLKSAESATLPELRPHLNDELAILTKRETKHTKTTHFRWYRSGYISKQWQRILFLNSVWQNGRTIALAHFTNTFGTFMRTHLGISFASKNERDIAANLSNSIFAAVRDIVLQNVRKLIYFHKYQITFNKSNTYIYTV